MGDLQGSGWHSFGASDGRGACYFPYATHWNESPLSSSCDFHNHRLWNQKINQAVE
jgi:hypothetical protein